MALPTRTTNYQLFIASPGDLAEDRLAAVDAVERWNRDHGERYGVRFDPIRWETHSSPRAGVAQTIINLDLVDQCDLLLAIFWTRFGQPTAAAKSGTLEELERAETQGKETILLFCERALPPSQVDLEQLRQVRNFRNDARASYFYQTYVSPSDLRELLGSVLSNAAERLLALPETAAAEQSRTVTDADNTTPDDRSGAPKSPVDIVGMRIRNERGHSFVPAFGTIAEIDRDWLTVEFDDLELPNLRVQLQDANRSKAEWIRWARRFGDFRPWEISPDELSLFRGPFVRDLSPSDNSFYSHVASEWRDRLKEPWARRFLLIGSEGRLTVSASELDAADEFVRWIRSRAWPGTWKGLEHDFLLSARLVGDIAYALGLIVTTRPGGSEVDYWFHPFYKNSNETTRADDEASYLSTVNAVKDLGFEFGRLSNLLISVLRAVIEPAFAEGAGAIESFNCFPTYKAGAEKYTDAERFFAIRHTHSNYFDDDPTPRGPWKHVAGG